MDHERDDSNHPLPMPPDGHPLRKLGAMLTNMLDEYAWADAEHLLLTGWDQDRVDRETGAAWRKDSSLEVWFPMTAKKLAAQEEELLRTWFALKDRGHHPGRTDDRLSDCVREALEPDEDAQRFRWLCEHPDWYFIERLCRQFAADSATVFRAELRRVIDESRGATAKPHVKTAAEMRHDAAHDTSCVGAFARARPGKA